MSISMKKPSAKNVFEKFLIPAFYYFVVQLNQNPFHAWKLFEFGGFLGWFPVLKTTVA